MTAHRFYVIPLKRLIRRALVVILAAGLLLLLCHALGNGVSSLSAHYIPGTYATGVDLGEGRILVEVQVNSREILDVSVTNLSETIPVFYPNLQATADALSASVLEAQSTGIDVEEDFAITSGVLLNAIEESLAQARK